MMNPICGFCGEHEVMRRATSKRDFDALENGRCMSQANAKAER